MSARSQKADREIRRTQQGVPIDAALATAAATAQTRGLARGPATAAAAGLSVAEREQVIVAGFVVKGASLENGLLHVDLVRELPEAMKPRTIPIETKSDKPRVIDSKAA